MIWWLPGRSVTVGHPWKYITVRSIYTNEIFEILDWPAIRLTYLIMRLIYANRMIYRWHTPCHLIAQRVNLYIYIWRQHNYDLINNFRFDVNTITANFIHFDLTSNIGEIKYQVIFYIWRQMIYTGHFLSIYALPGRDRLSMGVSNGSKKYLLYYNTWNNTTEMSKPDSWLLMFWRHYDVTTGVRLLCWPR